MQKMSVPSYAELGKDARDLFNKGYNFGFLKVDTTSRSSGDTNVEFRTSAAHTIASGKIFGNLDIKYKIPNYGMTLTEKWNTDNMLGTIIEVRDQFAKGLTVILDTCYAPHAVKHSGKIKMEWANRNAKLNADMSVDGGPLFNLSAVVNREGWLLGAHAVFDVARNKFLGTNLAFGRQGIDYTLHSYVNNSREFGGSLIHRAAHNVYLGAQLGWNLGEPNTRFGLAVFYRPSKDLELRAKVSNESQIALAATHYLSNQLKLTFSTQFGLSEPYSGGHKLGMGLEFSP